MVAVVLAQWHSGTHAVLIRIIQASDRPHYLITERQSNNAAQWKQHQSQGWGEVKQPLARTFLTLLSALSEILISGHKYIVCFLWSAGSPLESGESLQTRGQ